MKRLNNKLTCRKIKVVYIVLIKWGSNSAQYISKRHMKSKWDRNFAMNSLEEQHLK